MGIPSYFNFILKNHKKILLKKQFLHCDDLCIDANSLIYDCIHELNQVNDYDEIYNMVHVRILKLISIIQPSRKTYVCFDGVPAFPKMLQQRQRRFKSVLTKQIVNSNDSWNTNHITPGTLFMNGLDIYFSQKFKHDSTIIYSGSNEPMEGEHKICKLIRSRSSSYIDKNIVIYGLDADLIMLGLLLHAEGFNTFLYKETKHFEYISNVNKEDHYYFCLNVLANEIDTLLQNENKVQSIMDYIFICFLCGNDFMPHLPSIQIRNDGIHHLINGYKQTKKSLICTNTKIIQWSNFRKLIQVLCVSEDETIIHNLQWKMKAKQYVKGITYEDKLNFLPCMDTEKEKYLLQNMKRYNAYILETNDISDVCKDYLKILEWTWYYYNGIINDNRVYYSYSYGPKFSDLCKYIPLFDNHSFLDTTHEQPEIDVYSQLFFVLPHVNHKEIIPPSIYESCCEEVYTYLPQMKNMNYSFHYFLCKYFWERHLHMDKINIDTLNKIILHCTS